MQLVCQFEHFKYYVDENFLKRIPTNKLKVTVFQKNNWIN